MKAVCLSCFSAADEASILNDGKNRLAELEGSTFRSVKDAAALMRDLADPGLVGDVDILILAAHAYNGGQELEMRDKKTLVPVSAVVAALNTGGLPERAIVFLFACNGVMSPHWHRLFSAGQGPKMIIGPTRVARSVPLMNVLIRASDGLLREGLPKDRDEACAIAARRFLARDADGSGDEAPFLGVLWGASAADACLP